MNKIFRKTTLYIVRQDAVGNLQESAPCLDCLHVINTLNIKKIIFSSNDNTFKTYKPNECEICHESQGRKYLNNITNRDEIKNKTQKIKPTPKNQTNSKKPK
jgi:hypothetical protein